MQESEYLTEITQIVKRFLQLYLLKSNLLFSMLAFIDIVD